MHRHSIMPTGTTCSHVNKLFTPAGGGHPRCPFTFQELVHGSSDSTFEFCHWVPKHLQNKVPGVHLELDDNAGNFFPTVKIIEQNIELYQRIPNVSLRFKSEHNDAYDAYIVEVNPSLPHDHLLRQSTGANDDSSEVLVLFPKVSRPFVELHFRTFCTHHSISKCLQPCYTIQNDYPLFEVMQAEVLFSLIMLNSPFTKDARQAARKPDCSSTFKAPTLETVCSTYPERQLTKGQASKLVGQTIKLSSDLYPKWGTSRHFMEAYIARHSPQSRMFDIVFPADEADEEELDRFKRQYKGHPKGFNILVHTQSEAAIIKYGDPLLVQSLGKQFAGRTSTSTGGHMKRRKTETVSVVESTQPQAQVSNGCSSMKGLTTSSEIALPAGVREDRRIRVYWSSGWLEGIVESIDEKHVNILYDDGEYDRDERNDQEKASATQREAMADHDQRPANIAHSHARSEFNRIKFALIAQVVVQQEGYQMAGRFWTCMKCHLSHQEEEDYQNICCSKCKSLYREVGSAQPLGSKRPSRKQASTRTSR